MQKTRKSSLFAAYFILFIDNFGFAIVFPIFPILFLPQEGSIIAASNSETVRNLLLGLVLSAFPLAQFFGAPYFGELSDNYGRKRALYITIIGTTIGFILSAWAIAIKLFSLLLFSRLVTGFFAGNLAICMATISDFYSERNQKAKRMGFIAMLLGVSWVVAIILGSLLTNPDNRALFHPGGLLAGVALLSLSSAFVLYLFYEHKLTYKTKTSPSFLRALHHILHLFDYKQLRTLYLVLFFWFTGFIMALQWAAPISLEKFHVSQMKIMWMLILTGSTWAVASGLLNRYLVEKISLWHLMLWPLLATCICYFFAGVADFFPYFEIAFIISALFTALTWSNSISLVALAAHENEQGKALGIAQSMIALAQFTGPILGGVLTAFSVEPLLYSSALFLFIAFILLASYMIRGHVE